VRSGHFSPEVPECPHIGAYPSALSRRHRFPPIAKALQNSGRSRRGHPEDGFIAMQKVVGSNPISRF